MKATGTPACCSMNELCAPLENMGWLEQRYCVGMEGFGARSRVRTAKILELSTDLPIIVEIVDTPEKIEAFCRSSTVRSLTAWTQWKESRFVFTQAVRKRQARSLKLSQARSFRDCDRQLCGSD